MKITIKKVDRTVNWGVKDPGSSKFKPMFENCKDKLVPGLDKETGVLRTGLTAKEETDLEKKLGLEKGSLAKSSSYWNTFTIEIPEEGLVLNTENASHELEYKVLLADPTVSRSLQDLKTNAIAEYVMTSEGAEAKVSNSKRSVIANAYAIFAKMSKSDVVDALYMFGKDADTMEPEIAENQLGKLVDKDPGKFLKVVGDSQFKDKVWFMKLIKAGIVKKHGTGTGTQMPLYFEDIMLGNGLEEAIAFIKDKENQTIALGLKKALEA